MASFATSYIKTNGSTATRSADVSSIDVTEFGYNQSEGTVFVEVGSTNKGVLAALGDATFDSDYRIGNALSDQFVRANGAEYPSAVIVGGYTGQTKIAIGIKENDHSACGDGGNINTDVVGSLPVTPSLLQIGKDYSTYCNCHIKSIKYYPRRLLDSQLQELTS